MIHWRSNGDEEGGGGEARPENAEAQCVALARAHRVAEDRQGRRISRRACAHHRSDQSSEPCEERQGWQKGENEKVAGLTSICCGLSCRGRCFCGGLWTTSSSPSAGASSPTES